MILIVANVMAPATHRTQGAFGERLAVDSQRIRASADAPALAVWRVVAVLVKPVHKFARVEGGLLGGPLGPISMGIPVFLHRRVSVFAAAALDLRHEVAEGTAGHRDRPNLLGMFRLPTVSKVGKGFAFYGLQLHCFHGTYPREMS